MSAENQAFKFVTTPQPNHRQKGGNPNPLRLLSFFNEFYTLW